MTDYKTGMFSMTSDDNSFMDMFGDNFLILADKMKSWPGYENIADKLIAIKPKFMELGVKSTAPNKPGEGYNVLNHGDFHCKNMLFKKDEQNNFNEVLLIDFQLCNWASPALDIIYALYMVASTETRQNHREEIISYYYEQFVLTLKDIALLTNIPTLLDLQAELIGHGFFEVFIAVCFMGMRFLDFSKINMDDMMDPEKGRKLMAESIYGSEGYKDCIKKELKRFLNKGFLD